MKNKSVAILDVRSYEVTFLIGGKGVNGTFVRRGSKSEKYEGYTSDGFLDEQSFRRAVRSCVDSVLSNYDGEIKEIFVGVPSAFSKVYTKGHTISFPSKRRLTGDAFDFLFESGLSDVLSSGEYVCRSDMYFSTGDNRKYFSSTELLGASTSLLKGALCYYFADEKFYAVVQPLLKELGFEKTQYVPATLAQSLYLLPKKKREGYAFLLDFGFLSSSVSVVYGNGIVHEETFDFGAGHILLSLMDSLGLEYEQAEEILLSADVSGGAAPKELTWTSVEGVSYSVGSINEIIKYNLDEICERVDGFFSKYYRDKSVPNFAQNPISLTGEGCGMVRGAAEHISKRLGRLTEIVSPDLPYYDKPAYSSQTALLSYALSKREKQGLKQKLFNVFGGKNK